MDIRVLASGSSGNCYRVSDGETTLLLDAGISVKRIRQGCGFSLSSVSAALITHSHGDHIAGLRGLLGATVDCYMTAGEIEAAGLPPHHRLHTLDVSKRDGDSVFYCPFIVGTMAVTPFQTKHDTPEPVGYLIYSTEEKKKLLYFTDTYYLLARFSGVTHIIGEVNYTRETAWEHINSGDTPGARAKRLFSTHMSLETFLGVLAHIDQPEKIEQVWVCHMSDDHGDEDKIREAIQRETGAEVIIC